MRDISLLVVAGVAGLQLALAGCTPEPKSDPDKDLAIRRQAKREQAACSSQVGYDQLKRIAFDQAIRARNGDRVNLDRLADFSLARMEQPKVTGRDNALEITRCEGRLILDLPPGAEAGFGGERQLSADVAYSAQASADGNGYIYEMSGADTVSARLAAFNLQGQSYSAPGAMDETQSDGGSPTSPPPASPQPPRPIATPGPSDRADVPTRTVDSSPERRTGVPERRRPKPERGEFAPGGKSRGHGAATVRGFYEALRAGSGATASNYIVPEKRSSRAYSPEGISRFYGRLREPLQLTGVTELSDSYFQVTYRYSAGRTRCNGRAMVTTTTRGGRTYIRHIKSLSGC